MKWVELIRVRSSADAVKEAIPSLKKKMDEISQSTSAEETFMANHALYDGDLSVVVVWNNDVEPMKSREGLLLAEHLCQLGPVDHAVWIPVK
ncbi:MAG: hypothetical protein MJE63_10415 [Proteobacteria bacterium]|nr:hypothetical protein [Pseudomonadota bacterium]